MLYLLAIILPPLAVLLCGKPIQVEIPDDAEEVPASEMREGRHVLDELLKGRVLIFTRFGFAVGVAAPLPGPGSPTREVKE